MRRVLRLRVARAAVEPTGSRDEVGDTAAASRLALRADYAALPFPERSLDMVVLPHTLELNVDPHATLREVDRVLVPEGRVVICGLNPASLWGLRQRRAHLTRRLGIREPYLPDTGEFIGYWRMRDWLRLLGFEVESSRFGCYRPAVRSARWLARFEWMDRLGERWWPHFRRRLFHHRCQAGPWHASDEPGMDVHDGAREKSCFHSKLSPAGAGINGKKH
jgi:SAM-dependent methyltransferase